MIGESPEELPPPQRLGPARAIVRWHVPKHRCPICRHVCFTNQYVQSHFPGRVPYQRMKVLAYLKEHGTKADPLTPEHLAETLGYERRTILTVIYRLRKEGVPVRFDGRQGYRGYWLPTNYVIPDRLLESKRVTEKS